MRNIPLTRQEIHELLLAAKASLGQERSEQYGHPAMIVQYRLEQGTGEDGHRDNVLRHAYIDWVRDGAPGDITNEIDAIINGNGAEGKVFCDECNGYYLPHAH